MTMLRIGNRLMYANNDASHSYNRLIQHKNIRMLLSLLYLFDFNLLLSNASLIVLKFFRNHRKKK